MAGETLAPTRSVTSQTQLPLSRVKKIIAVDPDIATCSSNATALITLATELFVQHLATEAHNATKLDRKPRRNIQYKDVVTAISHKDHLEFLEDIVPKAQTTKRTKEATSAKSNSEKNTAGKKQKQLNMSAGGWGLTAAKDTADEQPEEVTKEAEAEEAIVESDVEDEKEDDVEMIG